MNWLWSKNWSVKWGKKFKLKSAIVWSSLLESPWKLRGIPLIFHGCVNPTCGCFQPVCASFSQPHNLEISMDFRSGSALNHDRVRHHHQSSRQGAALTVVSEWTCRRQRNVHKISTFKNLLNAMFSERKRSNIIILAECRALPEHPANRDLQHRSRAGRRRRRRQWTLWRCLSREGHRDSMLFWRRCNFLFRNTQIYRTRGKCQQLPAALHHVCSYDY